MTRRYVGCYGPYKAHSERSANFEFTLDKRSYPFVKYMAVQGQRAECQTHGLTSPADANTRAAHSRHNNRPTLYSIYYIAEDGARDRVA